MFFSTELNYKQSSVSLRPQVPEPHGNCLFYFHGLNIVPSLCTQYSVQRVHKSLYFEQLLQIITGFRPADKLKIDTHACSVCQLKIHLQIFTNHESKQRWPNMLMREWIWSQIEIINVFTQSQSVDPPPPALPPTLPPKWMSVNSLLQRKRRKSS